MEGGRETWNKKVDLESGRGTFSWKKCTFKIMEPRKEDLERKRLGKKELKILSLRGHFRFRSVALTVSDTLRENPFERTSTKVIPHSIHNAKD